MASKMIDLRLRRNIAKADAVRLVRDYGRPIVIVSFPRIGECVTSKTTVGLYADSGPSPSILEGPYYIHPDHYNYHTMGGWKVLYAIHPSEVEDARSPILAEFTEEDDDYEEWEDEEAYEEPEEAYEEDFEED